MQVVILAGGLGTRLSEETSKLPKPMVTIGELPILVHIMKWYAKFGHKHFVVALGYKGEVIKEYFKNYRAQSQDIRVQTKEDGYVELSAKEIDDWTIDLIDTGTDAQTARRLLNLRNYLDNRFMLTYGDGLSNVNLDALLRLHTSSKKIATVTAVRPPARFGSLQLEGSRVISFSEKNSLDVGWINGGFFVFEKEFLDFIPQGNISLESEPMNKLVECNQLAAFKHEGFWLGMDTIREREILQQIWINGEAPWLT